MPQITSTALPDTAFLARYEAQPDTHTDCYHARVAKHVPLERFINAFFNSWLFRIERLILKLSLTKPATDQDIANLANGTSNNMAAWRIEERDDDQILLEVPDTPIRTWPMREDAGDHTNLYFGSAILPMRTDKNGKPAMGHIFIMLMGFHQIYARALLYLAKRALR